MTRLQRKQISDIENILRSLVLQAEEEYGSTKTFFAKKINTSLPMFSLWMQGKRNLSVDQIDYLESLLVDKFRLCLP
jgi:hypothetical protein